VINHLIERTEEDRLDFDFIVGKSNRLLRCGVEREARKNGLNLEEAITITYFPAQPAPDLEEESEEVPDWISAISTCGKDMICTASYDGSLNLFKTNGANLKTLGSKHAHSGAISCLSSGPDNYIASGSMDHTLAVHQIDKDTFQMKLVATAQSAAAIGRVDFFSPQLLASGDWNGALCVWDCSKAGDAVQHASKKTKTSKSEALSTQETLGMSPKVALQAHSSKISGCSWGNHNKRNGNSTPTEIITGSWDHSIKVWNIEQEDCLLTLNGSRVVSCLDTSYHTPGIVATGHPDCTVRLWDVRTNEESTLISNSLKPSHKEWVSDVKWSPDNPYHVGSTSYDGTIKVWDIRSSLPLHTVRAFAKGEKGLCLAYTSGTIYAGGSDCKVKAFQSNAVEVK
jgi:ribosome biogenesis protein YTM1